MMTALLNGGLQESATPDLIVAAADEDGLKRDAGLRAHTCRSGNALTQSQQPLETAAS